MLVCIPKPSCDLVNNKQAKHLWSQSVAGYVITNLSTLRGSPAAVLSALSRHRGDSPTPSAIQVSRNGEKTVSGPDLGPA